MTSYNTWGTSWGTSWALSWTRSSSTPVRDTHDAWIPDEVVRKFYENERLKHSKVIKAYKKAVTEPKSEELKEIVNEYSADTKTITKSILNEIAEDKIALNRLLVAIHSIENNLEIYQKNAADDQLLIMIAQLI